ncbi:MAG: LPS export ABC transporter permease LptG [Chromatiales bacterium]
MILLSRYIGRRVVAGTVWTLLVLTTLLGFFFFIEELGDVGDGSYRTADAALYVLLILPRYAYETFPVAALIGSLIGLGSLANHSELTAMRAGGMSLGRIVSAVLATGALMLLAASLLGEVVAPPAEQYAETMRAEKRSGQITLKTEYGFWARDGSAFLNIRSILPGSRLEDIYIYEFAPDRRLKAATHAAFAQYAQGRWLLRDIRQSLFRDGGVDTRQMDEAGWESMVNPALLSYVTLDPNVLPSWGLYRYVQFMRDNGQSAIRFEVAFWGKVLTPFVTLVMLFLSVPFVFGSLRAVSIAQRVFVGTLVGVGFLLLTRIASYLAMVYTLDPFLTAAFPGVAILGLALWLARRVH